MFDFIFNMIELNMREIGYGDMTINKNMKFLVKTFYNILLNCENYKKKSLKNKNLFLLKYLTQNSDKKSTTNAYFSFPMPTANLISLSFQDRAKFS